MNGNVNNLREASRPGSVLNLLVGIWLVISPWVLGFNPFNALPVATWATVLAGNAAVVLAAFRLGTIAMPVFSWVNLAIGLWLTIAPFILGFREASTAMLNSLIMGIVMSVFSLWACLGSGAAAPSGRRP